MSADEQSKAPVVEVLSPEKQRISLVNETFGERLSPRGHFSSRKTSVNAEHSIDQLGPVRRKSILHNAAHLDPHSGHHFNYGYHATEDANEPENYEQEKEIKVVNMESVTPVTPEEARPGNEDTRHARVSNGNAPSASTFQEIQEGDGITHRMPVPSFSDKHWNGSLHSRPMSRTHSFASEKSKIQDEDADIANSWWYLFCLKCRQKETSSSSWEPPFWQKFCPYPFCPSYRQFARLLALILVGFLLWGVVYAIMGPPAAPQGQLFRLALLCICANFGGWIATLFTLPALVGMLAVGVLFQNVGLVHIDEDYKEVCSILRKIALVIILIRAGLDLDPSALRRLYLTVMKLGLVPWIIECSIIAALTHFLMGLPWNWGFLLGSVIAAISPAVVVPCLFRLRSKGYGIAKGIPTLIIAISGIDDALSVAAFGIIHGIMFSDESLVFNIIQGPVSVIMGLGFGIFWGFLAKFVPEKDDPFVIPLRVLLLFGGGLIAVLGSEEIEFGGAGPLGCVTAAFISFLFWSKQGWDVDDNPAATAFEIFWMIFEPILFGITGTEVKIDEMDPENVKIAVLCLIAGILIRMILTIAISFGDKLNLKEKIFVGLALMAKATVQAALGPVAMDSVRKNPSKEDEKRAEIVLLVCIMSIVLTAPIGAVIITLTGPRLLTKTSSPPNVPEWRRRSHRPSIRDISIIDEEEELEGNLSNLGKLPKMLEETEIVDGVKKEASSKTNEAEENENKS